MTVTLVTPPRDIVRRGVLGSVATVRKEAEPRTIVRARGPFVLNLRSIGLVVSALLVPVAGVPGRPGLSIAIACAVFVVWQALLFRPRIVVDDRGLHVYRLFRSLHRPVATIESIDLLERRLLWYPTRQLCLVIDGRTTVFPWVAWMGNTEAWFGWSKAASQERVLAKLRRAASQGDGSGQPRRV